MLDVSSKLFPVLKKRWLSFLVYNKAVTQYFSERREDKDEFQKT